MEEINLNILGTFKEVENKMKTKLIFALIFVAVFLIAGMFVSADIFIPTPIEPEEPPFEFEISDNKIKYKGEFGEIEIEPYLDETTPYEDFDWYIETKTIYDEELKKNITKEIRSFYPVPKTPLNLTEFHWFVNKLQTQRVCERINPYYSICSYERLDFSTFENKNEITNKTVKEVLGLENEFGEKTILGYLVSYYGLIINLDPTMQLLYDGASDIIFNNITEGSAQGARIDAPVLFMDFNKPPEVLDDVSYINYSDDYVQDNSVYNNYGDAGNLLEDGQWVNGNFSNGLEFDDADDWVDCNDGASSGLNFPLNNFSLCYWIYDGHGSNVIIRKGGGYSTAAPGYSIAGGDGVQMSSTNKVIYNGNPGGTQLTTDIWQFFCLVINRNGNITKYVNNVSIGTGDISADSSENISTTLDFLIGQSGVQTIHGTMDEMRVFNRTINHSEISSLYSSNTVLDSTGLVSHWALNETSGLLAEDTVGIYNGTLKGYSTHNPTYNASCTAFTGSGGCYEFDGVDDYVDLTNEIDVGTGSFTVSVWVFTTDLGSTKYIIDRTSNTPDIIQLYRDSDDAIFRIRGSDSAGITSVTSANVFTINNWHHIVGVRDAEKDTINIYVDGVNVTPVTDGTTAEISIIPRIGAEGITPPTYSWNGSIDQAQIWDRALSADEISTLYSDYSSIGKYSKSGNFSSLVFYNSTSVYWNTTFDMANSSGQGIDLTDPNLVSYWNLDEDYLDTMGINDGTATNPPNNATGLSSDAMMFDGVDDYVDVADDDSLSFTNGSSDKPFSVSAWIKLSELGVNNPIVSKFTDFSSNNVEWVITVISTNELELRLYNNGLATGANQFGFTTTETLLVDLNYHAVFVYDGNANTDSVEIYINGIPTNAITGVNGGSYVNMINTNSKVSIGGSIVDESAYKSFFSGSIDEVLIYNDTITSDEVKNLYQKGLSQHADTNISLSTRTATSYNLTDTSLVSQWSFNSDNNGTDEKGLNDGSCDTSATCPTWGQEHGVVGGGYNFDGSDDCVTFGDIDALDGLSDITVSVWVYTDDYDRSGMIVMKDNVNNVWQLYTHTTGDGFIFWRGNLGTIMQIDPPTINQWHHLLVTQEGTTATIYVDGILANTTTVNALGSSTGDVRVGCYGGSSYYFTGSIDEVRIYNRSLSASEIQNLYSLSNHYIEWGDWSSATYMIDDVKNQSSTSGNFFQFRVFLKSNNTEVSPYVINHTVGLGRETTPPTINITYPPNNSVFTNYSVNISLNISANDTESGMDSYWWSRDDGVTNHTLDSNESSISWGVDYPGDYNYTIMVCANDTVGNIACTYIDISITILRTPASGAGAGEEYMHGVIPLIEELDLELKTNYYLKGKKLSFVYSKDQKYDAVSFEVIGKNDKLYRILNISIVNATPQQFDEALPLASTDLRILQEKVLWESEVIDIKDFEEKNITFWLEVEGINEKTYERVKGEAETTLIIGKIRKEDTLLYALGQKIFPSNPAWGIVVLFLMVFIMLYFVWDYEIQPKINTKLNKLREKNKIKRKREYRMEEGI